MNLTILLVQINTTSPSFIFTKLYIQVLHFHEYNVCIYLYACVYIYIYLNIYIYIRMYTHTHIYIYIRLCMHWFFITSNTIMFSCFKGKYRKIPGFHGKVDGFRFRFSLKSIHWYYDVSFADDGPLPGFLQDLKTVSKGRLKLRPRDAKGKTCSWDQQLRRTFKKRGKP